MKITLIVLHFLFALFNVDMCCYLNKTCSRVWPIQWSLLLKTRYTKGNHFDRLYELQTNWGQTGPRFRRTSIPHLITFKSLRVSLILNQFVIIFYYIKKWKMWIYVVCGAFGDSIVIKCTISFYWDKCKTNFFALIK